MHSGVFYGFPPFLFCLSLRHLTLGKLEAIFRRYGDVDGVKITPHCLRHGGASRDALEKLEDLRGIQRRGRWKARESVRRYEKAGTLLRVRSKFAPAFLSRGLRLGPTLPAKLRAALKKHGKAS